MATENQTDPTTDQPTIRNRVVGLKMVKGSEIVPRPDNWRTHPKPQRDALAGVLESIGIADALVARQRADGRLELLDGHLRQDLGPDVEWPVLVLDVDDQEARLLLATLDPLAGLAGQDNQKLAALLEQCKADGARLEQVGWPDHLVEPLLAAEWKPPDLEAIPQPVDPDKAAPITLTAEQRETIEAAVETRRLGETKTLSEGRAVALICHDYLMRCREEALFGCSKPDDQDQPAAD